MHNDQTASAGKTGRPRLLTVPQVADALGITQSCVRRWLLGKKLAHVKLGRLVRVLDAEVGRLISEGSVPARPKERR